MSIQAHEKLTKDSNENPSYTEKLTSNETIKNN